MSTQTKQQKRRCRDLVLHANSTNHPELNFAQLANKMAGLSDFDDYFLNIMPHADDYFGVATSADDEFRNPDRKADATKFKSMFPEAFEEEESLVIPPITQEDMDATPIKYRQLFGRLERPMENPYKEVTLVDDQSVAFRKMHESSQSTIPASIDAPRPGPVPYWASRLEFYYAMYRTVHLMSHRDSMDYAREAMDEFDDQQAEDAQ